MINAKLDSQFQPMINVINDFMARVAETESTELRIALER